MAIAIPGHFSEELGHRADVGEAGEGEAETNKSCEGHPIRAYGECERGGAEDQQACAQTNLTLEGPAGLHIPNDRQPSLNPSAGAAFEN